MVCRDTDCMRMDEPEFNNYAQLRFKFTGSGENHSSSLVILVNMLATPFAHLSVGVASHLRLVQNMPLHLWLS